MIPPSKNEPIRSLTDLVWAAHQAAQARGEWPIDGRPLVESINDLHAEISTAWQDYRAKKISTFYQSLFSLGVGSETRPWGFWVEIEDAFIRLADLAGGEGWQVREVMLDLMIADCQRLAEVVHVSHQLITDLFETTAKVKTANQLFAFWMVAAGVNDVDLWVVIDEKMKFNAQQPQRPGGMLA